MGQILGPDSDGSHRVGGQHDGQTMKSTMGGGVEMNKFGAMVTTEGVRKPPPSGGGGLMCSCTGEGLPLQVSLGQGGAQKKNGKIVNKQGFQT